MNLVAGQPAGFLADHDVRAVLLVGGFEPAGDVHGVADDRVVEANLGTDIADQHVAGVDADAHLDGAAVVVDKLGGAQGALARQRRPAGGQRVVRIVERRAPERHDGIADELVDGAAVRVDLPRHHVEIRRQQRHDPFAHAFGQAGEAGDIGEQHRHRPHRSAGPHRHALRDQRPHQIGRECICGTPKARSPCRRSRRTASRFRRCATAAART